MSSAGTPPRPESDPDHERRLRVVGQLAGGIAHDFNNLLTAILGAADAILDRADTTAETAEDARQIRRGVERGAALVRQLLAFSRQQALQPRIVTVNAAIEDAARLLRRLLGEKVTVALVAGAAGAAREGGSRTARSGAAEPRGECAGCNGAGWDADAVQRPRHAVPAAPDRSGNHATWAVCDHHRHGHRRWHS